MTEWRANEFVWVQLYEILKERIEDGTYQPDMPIPSEPQLEQEFGVARKTSRKAVHRLRAEGLVYTRRNLGTFVCQRDETVGDEPPKDPI